MNRSLDASTAGGNLCFSASAEQLPINQNIAMATVNGLREADLSHPLNS